MPSLTNHRQEIFNIYKLLTIEFKKEEENTKHMLISNDQGMGRIDGTHSTTESTFERYPHALCKNTKIIPTERR